MGFSSITHRPPGAGFSQIMFKMISVVIVEGLHHCHHDLLFSHFIHSQPSKVHHHINDNLPRVIGRLCGQKSLVNCIALEENEAEDLVACGSTDTTVRVRTVRLEYIVLPERSSLRQHRPLLQSVFAFLSQCNVNVSQRSLRITTVVLLQQKATHTNFATHTHQHH